MDRINVGTYTVKPGETVRVEVRAVHVQNFETYTVDDDPALTPVSDDPRAYEFVVTVPPGFPHRTNMNGFFPEDVPANAKYALFISGDMGGGMFTGPEIRKTDISKDCNITFHCEE